MRCFHEIYNYVKFVDTKTLKKSNLHNTGGITPKRETSSGAHLRNLALRNSSVLATATTTATSVY